MRGDQLEGEAKKEFAREPAFYVKSRIPPHPSGKNSKWLAVEVTRVSNVGQAKKLTSQR